MAAQFDVVGYDLDGEPLYVQTQGDVLGDGMEGDVLGDGMEGDLEGDELVGRRQRGHRMMVSPRGGGGLVRARARGTGGRGPQAGQRLMKVAPKPEWRAQMAPGVIAPDEGMIPLPMQAMAGGTNGAGWFDATGPTQITWQGQLQKPFRGERILASVVRGGATARLMTQIYVGTDLQQAEIAGWDLELLADPGSFGTRLTMQAAEPGVLMRVVCTLSANLTGSDAIFCTVLIVGRVIH